MTRFIPRPGTPITNETDFHTALSAKGLYYQTESVARFNPRTGKASGFYEIYRTDTGDMLGAGVTGRFHLVQNSDAFGPMGKIAADMALTSPHKTEISNARVWDGGRSAALTMQIGRMNIGDAKVGDEVGKQVNIINHHGGNGSIQMSYATLRKICGNGACAAVGARAVTIRHTATAAARLAAFYAGFEIIQEQAARTEATYQALALTPMDRAQRKAFLDKLVPQKGSKLADRNAEEQIREMFQNMENADGGFTPRDTAWNAFNGVTHFATHQLATRSHNGKTAAESRDQSLVNGAGAALNERALKLLVEELSLEGQIAAILAGMDTTPAAMALAGMAEPGSVEDILAALGD